MTDEVSSSVGGGKEGITLFLFDSPEAGGGRHFDNGGTIGEEGVFCGHFSSYGITALCDDFFSLGGGKEGLDKSFTAIGDGSEFAFMIRESGGDGGTGFLGAERVFEFIAGDEDFHDLVREMLPLIGEPNTLVGRKMQSAIGLVELLAGDEIDPFIRGDDVDVSEGDFLSF